MPSRHVSIRTLDELVAKVDQDAERLRRSRSFIITEILEKYYENGQAKPTHPTTKKKAGSR